MSEISNSDDIIDSRDVIKRIEELEEEQTELKGDWDELSELDAPAKFLEWEAEYGAELDTLRKLADQCEGYGDWAHGEALIRESYFQEYAQQLAEDIGAIKPDADWPYTCIDWERAAKDLSVDYTHVEFDGVTYLMRS